MRDSGVDRLEVKTTERDTSLLDSRGTEGKDGTGRRRRAFQNPIECCHYNNSRRGMYVRHSSKLTLSTVTSRLSQNCLGVSIIFVELVMLQLLLCEKTTIESRSDFCFLEVDPNKDDLLPTITVLPFKL